MIKKEGLLFISTLEHLPWGGCEDLWYKTALLALEADKKVLVLCFGHESIPAHLLRLKEKGAHLYFLQRRRPTSFIKRIILKTGLFQPNARTLQQLSTELLKIKVAHVFISQAGGFDFAYGYLDDVKDWLLKQAYPFTIVVQNVAELGCTLSLNEAAKQQAVYEKAVGVGFVSERNLFSTERVLAAKVPHHFLINNPLNYDEIPHYIPYPTGAIAQFAVVAALRCFHKGQDMLLQVLSAQKWMERSWELHLYGEGPDEMYLKKLVAFYTLEKRVFFHGHVKAISEVWSKHQLHILPSLGEGTPLALIESMLAGRAVVTTDVGGNASYATHLENGFIASYPTLPSLDAVMELAWQHEQQWEEMGKKGRDTILASYHLHPQKELLQQLLSS